MLLDDAPASININELSKLSDISELIREEKLNQNLIMIK